MNITKALVKNALAAGYLISVYDGEDWPVKRCGKYTAIIEAIGAVEEAEIVIRDAGKNKIGWAWVTLYGAPNENLIDCTDNDEMMKLTEGAI